MFAYVVQILGLYPAQSSFLTLKFTKVKSLMYVDFTVVEIVSYTFLALLFPHDFNWKLLPYTDLDLCLCGDLLLKCSQAHDYL